MKNKNDRMVESATVTKNRKVLILILGILSAIVLLSIDMYLPGFPVIAGYFNTTVDGVSYSLASFFAGICLGQLIAGTLIDRFERKNPHYIGLVIYILANTNDSRNVWL